MSNQMCLFAEFQLTEFVEKFNIPDINDLSDTAVALLIEEMGIAQLLKDIQCVKGKQPFLETTWNSGKLLSYFFTLKMLLRPIVAVFVKSLFHRLSFF